MIKGSISEIFQLNKSRIFFEMHNLYIIWLYAFQFITCGIEETIYYICSLVGGGAISRMVQVQNRSKSRKTELIRAN